MIILWGKINPFDPWSDARGMPFDKLNAPSSTEGLRVSTERRALSRFKHWALAPSNVLKEE